MITDATTLADMQASWTGALGVQARIKRDSMGAFTMGRHFPRFTADAAHNVPFLLACGVLNDVLLALRDQGAFASKQRTLDGLMADSRGSLAWLNYARMDQIKDARNALAHDGKMLSRGDCWAAIDDIGRQLIGWGIVAP